MLNTPNVDRRVAPKKDSITDEAADAVKSAAMRMPRLWVWIILGAFFWAIVILAGWAVYANWIAPTGPVA